MVEALSHFLWPDSRDPVAGVAYEAPKVSGQPAPVIVEIGAGVHIPELTIKTSQPCQKRDCQQRRRP
jgi:hypothetical protein